MKKRCLVSMLAGMSILLCSCSPNVVLKSKNNQAREQMATASIEAQPTMITPELQQGQAGEQNTNQKETVFVYMVGSNLESEGALASKDIKEMVESKYDTNVVDVIICTGGATHWWLDGIPSDSCNVYKLENGTLHNVYKMQNKNMGKEQTLLEFLNYGFRNYSASTYGLVLWNHGGGALLGYGADENYKYDSLSMAELNNALAKSELCKKQKFEWVGFDACLMGMMEVAHTMEPYSKYLIASEEVEAGAGWNYSFLKELGDKNHFAGDKAAESIINSYSDFYETTDSYKANYSLSCMDLSKTEEVTKSLENFVISAENTLKEGQYSKIARIRDKAKSFGKVSDTSYYDTVDLYDLAERTKSIHNEEATNLQSAIQSFITYQKTNIAGAHGLAIYFPYENKKYASTWLDQYGKLGFSDTYLGFVKDFTKTLSGEQLTQWNIQDTTPTQSSEKPDQYGVQLTNIQMENYAHAAYTIWEEDSKDTYICWMYSSDVNLSDKGFLSSDFDGRKFYIGDTTGNKILCTALENERTDDYVIYSIPLCVSTKSGDYKTVYAHVKVTKEKPDGEIIGFYSTMNTDSGKFPNKNYVKLEKGDYIYPFYFARKIKFKKDGSVEPFSKWESASGSGKGFSLSGDFTITRKDADKGEKFCCLFQVTDTQGNGYYTNPVYIKK